MKILDAQARDTESGCRVEAKVVWEDSERPAQNLFFEAVGDGAERYRASLDAILLAAALPAREGGERRVALSGAVCPRLVAGIQSAEILFRKWFGDSRKPLRIEPSGGFSAPRPPLRPRAAAFFSGGVDSTFFLSRNLQCFPREHPAAVRELVFVFGRDHCGSETGDEARKALDRTLRWIEPAARQAGAALRVVITNARTLWPETGFFGYRYQTAYLSAAAHGWSGELSSVSLGSGWDVSHLVPWGTHPLLDRWWSTTALAIRHEDAGFSRWQKLEFLARLPERTRGLIVCNEAPSGDLPNCGVCFKCIETTAAFASLGVSGSPEAFPAAISAEAIESVTLAPNLRPSFFEYRRFWEELRTRLRRAGRPDLALAVERKLRDAGRHEAWLAERDWKGWIRRADRRFLAGRLTKEIRRRRSER